MRISRKEPGFAVSAAAHGGLLVAALVFFSDAGKFDDAQEAMPVEVLSDSQFNQIMKGEKSARALKPHADRQSETAEHRPKPPLAEAKRDVPTPPPPLKRLPDPGEEDQPPTPPKRVAALPPPPAKPEPKQEAKPAPAPPAKPMAAAPAPPDQPQPDDAEVVRPRPPERPKPEAEAKEPPQPPTPPAERPKPRLKPDDVAKLLARAKPSDRTDPLAKSDATEGDPADKPAAEAKPKSSEETTPKSKFDPADIAKALSHEAPQRRAATGRELSRTASLGAPTGSAPKLSASMEGRIAQYIKDHYRPCWASGLTMGGAAYVPIVEFHLTREGALEGRPRLLNPSNNPVAQARGEQALQAVRRCSPMKIPEEFMPYYEEVLHEVGIQFTDLD